MTTGHDFVPEYIEGLIIDGQETVKSSDGQPKAQVDSYVLRELIAVAKYALQLQNRLETAHYEHGQAAEQSHRFAGRLGRINRMLDEAGVTPEGSADERLAKMLNRELPKYQ